MQAITCGLYLAGVLVIATAGRGWAMRAADAIPRGQGPAVAAAPAKVSPDQLTAAREAGQSKVTVEWNPRHGAPVAVRGENLSRPLPNLRGKGLPLRGGMNFAEDAIAVVDNLARLYRIQDAPQEFVAHRTHAEKDGSHHVRLRQQYRGLKVVGRELVVHFDKRGLAYGVTGRYQPDLDLPLTARIEAAEAAQVARDGLTALGARELLPVGEPALVVFALGDEPRLAHELTFAAAGPARWRCYMDALNGQLLLRYDDIKHVGAPTTNGSHTPVTGRVLAGEGGASLSVTGWLESVNYYLYNTNRHWLVFNNAASGYTDNSTYAYRTVADWGTTDRAEFSAGRNLDLTQRFFQEFLGRQSFNNARAIARANVHEGVSYVNAYWDGSDFHFGDGDGFTASPLVVLDVCAHEYGHAVTEHSADLIYAYESGALNESFSDIFGACVEFFAQADGRSAYPGKAAGQADWLLGEDCWLASTALRDMRNPRNSATVGPGGEQPSRYQGTHWYSGAGDNGGVHYNSGVQNFFFYLLSDGGSGNNDGISYSVTGIGITNAALVAYRALTVYCTPGTDYADARIAWLSAALDLNTNWVSAVAAAWDAVGIGASFLVQPATGASFGGPVGGPFTPTNTMYQLNNTSPYPVAWTARCSVAWIETVPGNGTLPAFATTNVLVRPHSSATGLSVGDRNGTVTFSNLTDHVAATRALSLSIAAPSLLSFDLNSNPGWSMQGQWAFGQPTGQGGAVGNPDPTSGRTGVNVFGINLAGDYDATVGGPYYLTTGPLNFSGMRQLQLQFWRHLNTDYQPFVYATVEVSNNGSTWTTVWSNGGSMITDSAWTRVVYDISAVADNCSTVYVRWGHRVASAGAFRSSGWNIDDVSFLGTSASGALGLALPGNTTEGSAPLTGQLSITPTPLTNTIVSLVSGTPGLVSVPSTVTFSPGQTNATFNLTIGDDALLNGSRTATISATASNYTGAVGNLTVHDNESATLTLSLPAAVTEGDAPATGTLFVNAPVATNVIVALFSSDTTELTVPATVTLPAGATNVSFSLTTVNDTAPDGPQPVTVTAMVTNWTTASTSVVVRDNEPLGIALATPVAATEGDGTLVSAGIITAPYPTNLTVTLSSSDPTKLTVPASVIIAAGETNGYFNITIVDNAALDGSQPVKIIASGGGSVLTNTVAVHDNEVGVLSVTLPASRTEGQGALTNAGTVAVHAAVSRAVTVSLVSSDTSELTVPASVTIAAGQTSATFTPTVVNDTWIDGSQSVTVTAHVVNWTAGAGAMTVQDNEPRVLTVTLPASAYEGAGTLTNAGCVYVSGFVAEPLTVNLASSNTGELTVPPTVTVPAGASNILFNVTLGDDLLEDGSQSVTVTATASSFTTGMANMTVADNDLHHFVWGAIGSVQTSMAPFAVSITAADINGQRIMVYTNLVGLTGISTNGAMDLTPTNGITFTTGMWTGQVSVIGFESNAVLIASDNLSHATTSSVFQVVRLADGLFIPVANRVDMVHDEARSLVYITAGDRVLRMNLVTGRMLPPFVLGGNLLGIDLSPDGNTLAVANSATSNGVWWAHLISLTNDAVQRVEFPQAFGEAGGYTVAYGDDGALLLTAQYAGSGWVPLRRYDPALQTTQTIASVRQNSMLSSSGDRRFIALTEANISSGPVRRYNVASRAFSNSVDTGWFTFECAANRDGSEIAVPTYGGTFIYDGKMSRIATLGSYASEGPIGAAYHPRNDLLFCAWWPSRYLRVYDSRTFTEVARYDCFANFGWVGNWGFGQGRVRSASDGNDIFVTVGGGVRWILRPSGPPTDVALTLGDAPDPVTLGSNVTFTTTVANAGTNTATGVVASLKLDASLTFIAAASSQGSVTQAAGVVTASLGALETGSNAVLTVIVRPNLAGPVVTKASVVADNEDPELTNNVASVLTSVGFNSAPNQINTLMLTASDLAYDPFARQLYASVPSSAGAGLGNSVVPFSPTNGLFGAAIFVGSEPNRLALTDNGQYLYVGLNGAAAVRRIDLASQSAELLFSLGGRIVEDIEAVPGQPGAVAVSRRNSCCSPRHEGVAIYDDGVIRSNATPGHTGSNVIEFGHTNAVLYGYNNETSDFGFRTMAVNASGVTITNVTTGLISGYGPDIEYDGGLLFTTTGLVIDPVARVVLGSLSNSGVIRPDVNAGRVCVLNGTTLSVYEPHTTAFLGSLSLTNISGSASRLTRWGADGLAFVTGGGQVFVLRTSLLPSAPATDLALACDAPAGPVTAGGSLTYTLSVTNRGPNPAGNVRLFDRLPAGMTATALSTSQGTCTQSNGLITATLGTLSNGADAVISITVVPAIEMTLTNIAALVADVEPFGNGPRMQRSIIEVSGTPALTVSPTNSLASAGSTGGPFSPASQVYTLTNSGTARLAWSASKTAGWLTLSVTNGTLLARTATTITVSINSAANALAAGNYADTVSVLNLSNGVGNATRAVSLAITPVGILSVSPSTNLVASGPQGGPFSMTQVVYTLANTGDASLNWTATKNAAWLALSATAGTLVPGASTNVTVNLAAAAYSLARGTYNDTVAFNNATNGRGNASRSASLTINSAPVATPQTVAAVEDVLLPVTLGGTDPDSDVLAASITALPANGSLFQTADGVTPGSAISSVPTTVTSSNRTLLYRSAANGWGNGHGNFSFRVSDGLATSGVAAVTVNVTPVNDLPVAMDDYINFLAGQPQITFSVTTNDVDADNDMLTVVAFTSPVQGTLQQTGPGAFTYTPSLNFTNSTDQFNYTISDGQGGTNSATVHLKMHNRYLDAGDWPMFGKTPSHTGYAPAFAGAEPLSASWSYHFSNNINSVAIGGGKVYVTPIIYFNPAHVTALDAETGEKLWRQDSFGNPHSINPPTYDNGRVYVQKGNHSSNTQLWCLDAATGATNWAAPHTAQWERYYAPTVVGDTIWVNGGTYGGLYGFSTNGTQRFFNSTLPQYDQWTPLYYEGTVYTWIAGGFRAHDPLAGTNLWTISTNWNWSGWSMNTVPVADDGHAFFVGSPGLYAVDLNARAFVWSVPDAFRGSPATARGVVYAITGNQVRAFRASDGYVLGNYNSGDGSIGGQPIVTDDSLFVAGSSATYVFDLQTRQLRQTLAAGGQIALANGRLFVAGSDGRLRTFVPPNSDVTDLALSTGVGLKSLSVGSNLVYSFTIANPGRFAANNVKLTDLLAPQETLVSATTSRGTWSATNGVFTAELGTLNPSETATITLLTQAIAPGSLTNQATVWSANADAFLANNTIVSVSAIHPNAPALAAEPAITGGTSNRLTWAVATGATTYEAQCATDPAFTTPVTSGWIAGTEHVFTNLADGTTYYYRVRSRKDALESTWSSQTSSRQDAMPPGVAITSPVSGSYTTNDTITVTGTATDGSGIAALTVGGLPVSTVNGFTNWTITLSGLSPGTNLFLVSANDTAVPANLAATSLLVLYADATWDGDGDQMADSWEIKHFGGVNTGAGAANADPDGDGLSNAQEFAAGTDPLSNASALRIESFTASPTGMVIRFSTVAGKLYNVEVSTQIPIWDSLTNNVAGTGSPIQITDPAALDAPRRFYRIKLQP